MNRNINCFGGREALLLTVVRLVEVFGISDGTIVHSDRHDMSGHELLLPLVLRDSPPAEDGSDGLGRILIRRALVLISFATLAIFSFVIVALLLFSWFSSRH